MRLNTRNFLLYLLAVAFLVIAITVTALPEAHVKPPVSTVVVGVSDEAQTYTAEVKAGNTPNRAARVNELRQKIAALPPLLPPAQASPATDESVPAQIPGGDEAVLKNCPAYQSVSLSWPSAGLQFGVVEGARLLYAEVQSIPDPASTDKTVYLQLPLQTGAPSNFSCLPYDVVGVATDGSPIRNTEVGLYRIFEAETLLGYALDGFPIYGVSPVTTDSCGGAVVDGQYRYYLSSERESILNCFAGLPVSL